ncbi:hypothetical protein ACFSM5_05355 [Lacibacterium aquatile]|uniref:Exo-alpha-sialidase n=1 Tax=Lacibacterium aquatile TaxID=1168082 RepID=A0ABW5DQZ2_9PROT
MTTTPAIMLCHRGVGGDNQIYWSIGVQDENNRVTWPRRAPIPFGTDTCRTETGVSVMTVGDVVYCAFVDTNDVLQCARYKKDANGVPGWTVEQMNGNMSDRRPCLIMFGDELWCLHRGAGGDHHLYYTIRVGLTEMPWSPDKIFGDTLSAPLTSQGPAAVVAKDNVLSVVYVTEEDNLNGQIRVVNYDEPQGVGQFSAPYDLSKIYSHHIPSLLWYKDRIVCIFKNAEDKKISTMTVQAAGDKNRLTVAVSPFNNGSGQTVDGPTLVQLRHRTDEHFALYSIYRGIGEDGWLYFSAFWGEDPFNKSKWVDERRVGEGDEEHNDFYEVGADSFLHDS